MNNRQLWLSAFVLVCAISVSLLCIWKKPLTVDLLGSPVPGSTDHSKDDADVGTERQSVSGTATTEHANWSLDELLEPFSDLETMYLRAVRITPHAASSHYEMPAPELNLAVLERSYDPDTQLREAIRWFESLPKGKKTAHGELEAAKSRMASVGIELSARECRQGICRLSFTYANRTSNHRSQTSASIRPDAWSFTSVAADGRIEGHIFVVSRNRTTESK